MIHSRSLLAAIGLSTIVGFASATAMAGNTTAGKPTKSSAPPNTGSDTTKQDKTPVKAEIEKPAPGFTLEDADGKEYSLSDYEGKIVVLQWINPDCPVCNRVCKSGLVNRMMKTMKEIDKDVVHLAINSTREMEPRAGAKYLDKHEVEAPALSDRAGTVGRLYGAKTTPHMFVIDGKGILRYEGAIDNDRRGRGIASSTNYVVNAVKQIVDGEDVSPDNTKPYGCSVKYARNKNGQGGGGNSGSGG